MASRLEPMRRGFAALMMLLAGACAGPTVTAMGPAAAPPRLESDAIVAADGYRLPLRHVAAEGKTRAAIVALHGFNDRAEAFDEAARGWAERGIATYAFDQRGFGRTETKGLWAGTETLVADAKTAIALVRDAEPDLPVVLVGESMGGAVAVLASIRAGEGRPDALALVAPAAWGRETMGPLEEAALWAVSTFFPDATFTGRDLGVQASDNIPMLVALGRDPLFIKETRADAIAGLVELMDLASKAVPEIPVPTLVLYGERDEVLPRRSIDRLLARLPDRSDITVGWYPDGWHMLLRDLKGPIVQADLAWWALEGYGDRLVSGADGEGRTREIEARRAAAEVAG